MNMKKLEKFFDIKTPCDRKHKLNTCNRKVPQDCLDRIEDGCSLEQLEEMVNDRFDIFKYGTQITIHGIFPELSVNRIGGYVNIVRNKNRSIGVRYTAIDRYKKERLFSLLRDADGWNIDDRSDRYSVYRMKPLPRNREEALEIVGEFKQRAEKINRDLFIGSVSCYTFQTMCSVYVCLDVNVCCFYEKNFDALFENLSGMSVEDGRKAQKEKLEKEAAERAARNARWEKEREEREKREAEEKEKFRAAALDFVSNTPPPAAYERREDYDFKPGDKVCRLYFDRYDKKFTWVECVCKKCFGTTHVKPADITFDDYWNDPVTLDFDYVAAV